MSQAYIMYIVVDDALQQLQSRKLIVEQGDLYYPARRTYGDNNVAITNLEEALLSDAHIHFAARTDI